LKNKIDEYEILISKMKFDKKTLEEKLENIIKEHKSEKNLMINYKNSEIKACNKLIEEYQTYFRNNNIDMNRINNRNNNMTFNGNENVDFQKLMMELSNKDKIIKTLKSKFNEISNDFNKIDLSQQNVNQIQIQKLVNEKNELIKENQFHKKRLSSFIEQIKEANNLLNKKTLKYQNDLNNMKMKLEEYKQKIIILKKKICEMHVVIGKLGNKSYQNVNSSSINNNIRDKKIIPSTPNQLNKVSIKTNLNNTGNAYFTQTPLMDARNGNIIMNNVRQYGNSVGGNKKDLSNDGLDQIQKKSLDNYRKFLSQLEQNMPSQKP
jgi:hypothetical protein